MIGMLAYFELAPLCACSCILKKHGIQLFASPGAPHSTTVRSESGGPRLPCLLNSRYVTCRFSFIQTRNAKF